eukprot:4982209-Amphidinium_carterae.1
MIHRATHHGGTEQACQATNICPKATATKGCSQVLATPDWHPGFDACESFHHIPTVCTLRHVVSNVQVFFTVLKLPPAMMNAHGTLFKSDFQPSGSEVACIAKHE